VRGYLKLGYLDTALETAGNMRDDYNKPRSLSEVAVKYAEKNNKEKAADVFWQALECASTIDDNFYKSWALAEIAVRYSEVGMKPDEKSKEVLKRIVEDTIIASGKASPEEMIKS